MVGMAVREYDLPQLTGVPADLPDRGGQPRGGAGQAGVDQGQAVTIHAQVGVPDREAQKEQAWCQLCDVHADNARPAAVSPSWVSATGRSYAPPWARQASRSVCRQVPSKPGAHAAQARHVPGPRPGLDTGQSPAAFMFRKNWSAWAVAPGAAT